MKVKTSELTGPALGLVVAQIEKKALTQAQNWIAQAKHYGHVQLQHGGSYAPYADWAQGGPIIEREGIHLLCDDAGLQWTASAACTYSNNRRLTGWRKIMCGPTPLIAAMRCYIASKIDDEVEIPEELL